MPLGLAAARGAVLQVFENAEGSFRAILDNGALRPTGLLPSRTHYDHTNGSWQDNAVERPARRACSSEKDVIPEPITSVRW